MSELGSLAARRYGIQSVPTLVVFDGDGSPVKLYAGIPNRKEIVEQVNLLQQ
jgi:thioredoxin-like negative regulator of GroEL